MNYLSYLSSYLYLIQAHLYISLEKPMLVHRESSQRGQADHGWLKSQHSFSFADYYDPKHTHFRHLRVINEDKVVAGAGFPTHSHSDMEIITYVIEGAIEHKDSMGNGSIIRAGEIQRMSAGSGLSHSEFNANQDQVLRFLQIWVIPNKKGLSPTYEQKSYIEQLTQNEFQLIASAQGGGNAVMIHQDINLFTVRSTENNSMEYEMNANRHVWIQLIKGNLRINEQRLHGGDGLAISNEQKIIIDSEQDSEFLLFDLN